ncbi:riboflavin synthase [Paenibacillus sp. JX-17]|uniref:Riboflavin synthase n=1 Tax=Paenibacillus lacisoli TaxID=3064525 RepID=A0ABT9C7A2_9BACL|nr:riboflavin synthase [Paenibacillus sp. JX-17]MDO7905116.1 riboflavin synthase [Paenibacillus sp. JX-17]
MFTGLIEEVGKVRRLTRKGEAMVITVEASVIMDDVRIGDSIAVNGVCLTVTELEEHRFSADIMPQTYRNSNLSTLQTGSKVNLERAMAAGGRFGGHIVQGHVDGTGTIRRVMPDQNAVIYEIAPDDTGLFRYIIARGSITIDGISLTVSSVTETSFKVSIIPHTLIETVLHAKHAGETVNLECDVLGKYVEHMLQFGQAETGSKQSAISHDYLAKHGFA